MNAKLLKIAALRYLRFERQLPYVSTEVSVYGRNGRDSAGGEADVFGASDKSSVEIETKISMSDFRRDFSHKKAKHAAYRAGCTWAPNYLYYLMPESLAKAFDVEQLLEEHQPGAGVLYVSDVTGGGLTLLRKGSPIHRSQPDPKLIRAIIKRMGSELCGLHLANYTMAEGLHQLSDKVLDVVRGAVGTHQE